MRYPLFVKKIFFVLILSSFHLAAISQIDASLGSIGNAFDSTAQKAVDSIVRPALNAYFIDLNQTSRIMPFTDTLLNAKSIQYDPIHRQDNPYYALGNLGSTAFPLYWQSKDNINIDIGINGYDLYNYSNSKPLFLVSNRLLVSSLFSQANDQKNLQLETRLAQTFKPNIHFYIDYRRIANAGIYSHQKGKHTGVQTGIWLNRKRWDTFILFTSNVNEEENNGGVSDLNTFDDEFNQVRTNVPVFLKKAATRVQEKTVLAKNIIDLNVQNQKIKLSHDISYNAKWFKYTDEDPDPDFYGQFHIDDRASRHFIQDNSINNTIQIFATNNDALDSTFIKSDHGYYFGLDVQLSNHFIRQEPIDYSINDLFLGGRIHYYLPLGIQMDGQAKIGLWDAQNTAFAKFGVRKNFDEAIDLSFNIKWLSERPTLIESRFILLENEMWENDFNNKNTFSTEAVLAIQKLNLEVSAAFNNIDGYIYFNEFSNAVQSQNSINIGQIRINQKLQFWKMSLESQAWLQQFNTEIIQLPNLYLKESLYFEGPVFKNAMYLKTGVDFRFANKYALYSYQPLLGQTYLSNETEGGLYPELDAFLSFKVSSLIAFVRAQNMYSLLNQDINFYMNRYPSFDFNIRFGLRWTFLD